MKPVRIKDHNTIFGADQAGVIPLPARRGEGSLGPEITAAFQPSPEEIDRLKAGGVIELTIVGTGWPPVKLSVPE